MAKKFKSTHGLKLQLAHETLNGIGTGFLIFKIGTCSGRYKHGDISIDLLKLDNENESGNGHETDVIEWLYEIARLENMPLRFKKPLQPEFEQFLIQQHGFIDSEHFLMKLP